MLFKAFKLDLTLVSLNRDKKNSNKAFTDIPQSFMVKYKFFNHEWQESDRFIFDPLTPIESDEIPIYER